MEYFDKELPSDQEQKLMEHLKHCPACKGEFDALSSAFVEMEHMKEPAPPYLELKIMKRIKKAPRKGEIILPLVIAPLIILLALAALGLHVISQGGLSDFLAQTIRFLTISYRTFSAAIALLEQMFNSFYMRLSLTVLVILSAIFAGIYIVRNIRKAKTSFNGG
jgi:predicted anti-sigma-YlaC factor YlaD